jgi:gliding motility-associated-like protein
MFFKNSIIFCLFLFVGRLSAQATYTVDAGSYKKICPGTQVKIGGNPTAQPSSGSYNYVWHPGKALYNYDSTKANPIAQPNSTTVYTVYVKDNNNPGAEIPPKTVTVYVYPYYVNAGPDVIIKAGQTITLHGQAPGDSSVYWNSSNGAIYNPNTLNPDVFPGVTTIYSLAVNFPHGCILYDDVKVTVLPSAELVFYNSFSPNGDGANDVFYIGNLGLYPDNTLEIYNRYGQKVLTKNPYLNDWGGNYLGNDLPSGTYFYILDTHADAGKFRGEVNIIR